VKRTLTILKTKKIVISFLNSLIYVYTIKINIVWDPEKGLGYQIDICSLRYKARKREI